MTEFLEGETYRNKETNQHIMILAIAEETDDHIYVAFWEIDPETMESTSADEMAIQKSDYDKWEVVNV